MAKSRLHQLSELGQSVWIDYLSRDLLRTGELARLHEEDAVVGVTSNPTIFQKAISAGDAYDEQLRQELEEERDAKELFLRLAVRDVQDALDLLRPVWDEGGGHDGYVSLEVDPTLAYDADGTRAQALELLADAQLVLARHGRARALLAVAHGGVENDQLVLHGILRMPDWDWSGPIDGSAPRGRAAGTTRIGGWGF